MSRIISVLALTLALSACWDGKADSSADASPVALVALGRAHEADIAQQVTLYGDIERSGDNQMVLAAPIEAVVASINAPMGTAVAAGQVVARLRPSPASLAQISAARADATAEEQALARTRRLRSAGLASDADVEAARSRAAAASALAASYNQRDAALVMRAPKAGFVDLTGASAGDLVQPGAAIATLSRAGKVQARFGIDPSLIRSLSIGERIEIQPSDGSPPFDSRISSLSPVAQQQSRLASILVDIPASRNLAVGQPLAARVAVRTARAGIAVPYPALLDDGGQSFVFVVKAGIAHRHDVVTGASDGAQIAITKGVAAGDEVVIAGGTGVEDGMKVRTK